MTGRPCENPEAGLIGNQLANCTLETEKLGRLLIEKKI
jgi:hypothetical protein